MGESFLEATFGGWDRGVKMAKDEADFTLKQYALQQAAQQHQMQMAKWAQDIIVSQQGMQEKQRKQDYVQSLLTPMKQTVQENLPNNPEMLQTDWNSPMTQSVTKRMENPELTNLKNIYGPAVVPQLQMHGDIGTLKPLEKNTETEAFANSVRHYIEKDGMNPSQAYAATMSDKKQKDETATAGLREFEMANGIDPSMRGTPQYRQAFLNHLRSKAASTHITTPRDPEASELAKEQKYGLIEQRIFKNRYGYLPKPGEMGMDDTYPKIPGTDRRMTVEEYQDIMKSISDEVRSSSRGKKVESGKQLDEATAKGILKEAGGDKTKARALAKARGYKY